MTLFSHIPSPLPAAKQRTSWPWTDELVDNAALDNTGTQWPRITVVTPSFNQEQFLEETIRSVLGQGYPELEYIIIDGGSTDDSIKIIENYASCLTHWESKPDDGPANAINRGFSLGTGDIMAWINSDDVYTPGTLFAIARQFMANQELQLVYGEGWYIDENSEQIEPCRFVRRSFTQQYLVNRDPILQPAAFWTSRLWQKSGPLNESLYWVFDWEWFIRAHEVTDFYYLPAILAYYRRHGAALTRTGGMARQLEHSRITRQYGGWWHPNHLVQQLRHIDHQNRKITNGWPRPLAWPFLALTAIPRLLSERVLHGMYMR